MKTNRKKLRTKPGLLTKRLLLVMASVAFALLAVEVYLRVTGFANLNPYIVDRDTEFSLRPRAEGWWDGEGLTYDRTNNDGLRAREHTKEKPAGTLRIAVLGDSFTEAFDVEMQGNTDGQSCRWRIGSPKVVL